jgi:hypothetical protein
VGCVKIDVMDPPRRFSVGAHGDVELYDCGRIALDPGEQVTLTTQAGAELDVTRKEWGFYATPSLNGRLASFGLRAVLVASPAARYFVLLVEPDHEAAFEDYRNREGLRIVAWLDSTEALTRLEEALTAT